MALGEGMARFSRLAAIMEIVQPKNLITQKQMQKGVHQIVG